LKSSIPIKKNELYLAVYTIIVPATATALMDGWKTFTCLYIDGTFVSFFYPAAEVVKLCIESSFSAHRKI